MKEIRIQEVESKAKRIEKAEISQEETELEIKCLQRTIQEIQALMDNIGVTTTAYSELKAFKKKLEQQIVYNNNILDEIKGGIEFIKTQ